MDLQSQFHGLPLRGILNCVAVLQAAQQCIGLFAVICRSKEAYRCPAEKTLVSILCQRLHGVTDGHRSTAVPIQMQTRSSILDHLQFCFLRCVGKTPKVILEHLLVYRDEPLRHPISSLREGGVIARATNSRAMLVSVLFRRSFIIEYAVVGNMYLTIRGCLQIRLLFLGKLPPRHQVAIPVLDHFVNIHLFKKHGFVCPVRVMRSHQVSSPLGRLMKLDVPLQPLHVNGLDGLMVQGRSTVEAANEKGVGFISCMPTTTLPPTCHCVLA